MKGLRIFLWLMLLPVVLHAANPVSALLDRLEKGASKHFIIEKVESDLDFFELDTKGDKIVVRGNTYVNISAGVRRRPSTTLSYRQRIMSIICIPIFRGTIWKSVCPTSCRL